MTAKQCHVALLMSLLIYLAFKNLRATLRNTCFQPTFPAFGTTLRFVMPGPNFKKIGQISILAVCEHLGIALKREGKTFRGSCPICDHPSKRAFSVTKEINRFWCHGFCRSGGDVLELYAQKRSLNKYNAALELLRLFPP